MQEKVKGNQNIKKKLSLFVQVSSYHLTWLLKVNFNVVIILYLSKSFSGTFIVIFISKSLIERRYWWSELKESIIVVYKLIIGFWHSSAIKDQGSVSRIVSKRKRKSIFNIARKSQDFWRQKYIYFNCKRVD